MSQLQNEGQLQELLERAKRNEAIAELMKFKRYLPSSTVAQSHSERYNAMPMQWYWVPEVGRYNSFELKFDRDWNWLVSALIELGKYKHAYLGKTDKLSNIYNHIRTTQPFDFDKKKLWIAVSDYALELLRLKEAEKQKHG